MKAKGTEGGQVIFHGVDDPYDFGLESPRQGLVRGLHVPGKGQEGQQVGKQDQVAVVTRSAQHTVPVYATEQKSRYLQFSQVFSTLWHAVAAEPSFPAPVS